MSRFIFLIVIFETLVHIFYYEFLNNLIKLDLASLSENCVLYKVWR